MTVSLLWEGRDAAVLEAESPASDMAFVSRDGNREVSSAELSAASHHVFIGDNFDVLRLLRSSPLRFHFVYIDPPYNTGQHLSFRDIHDSENVDAESRWLSMLYPRLACAHELLREDGIIFVSIDDRQMAALTLVMREIFGKENHIGTLKWRKKRKPSFLDKHIGTTLEYILVFAKNAARFPRLLGEKSTDLTRPVLNANNPISERILRKGTAARCATGHYAAGIRRNKTLEVEFLDDFFIEDGTLLNDVRVRGRFRVSQELLDKTVFLTPKVGLRRIVLEEELTRKHASDSCMSWPTNEDAEQELRAIFGSRVFDYPKPVGLIKNLLSMCQFPEEECLCLDFFAGSGTLAEAVLAQTAEDGKKRTFFLCQAPEVPHEKYRDSRFPTIADLAIARAEHALAKHNISKELVVLKVEKKNAVQQKKRKK